MKNKFVNHYYRMTGVLYKPGIKSLVTIFYSHQIRYMYWWRKESQKHTIFRRYKLFRYSRKYGLEISPTAKIGNGLYLGHPYNITVGGDAVIGNNVNLSKGCTIGRENRGKREGIPTIGNCVFVGINATIVGNIRIGNDVFIAPNSFVNMDIPDHSVVIGNPAVIYPKDNATESYINFRV